MWPKLTPKAERDSGMKPEVHQLHHKMLFMNIINKVLVKWQRPKLELRECGIKLEREEVACPHKENSYILSLSQNQETQ